MRKQLTEEQIHEKAARGLALTLTELAVATGYGYSTVRAWKPQGLPLVGGKITKAEALEWRRDQEVMRRVLPQESYTAGHHPLLAADIWRGLA